MSRQVHPARFTFSHSRNFECPVSMEFIGEGDGYLERLTEVAKPAHVVGGAIHDARIAAICKYHSVTELWSADRDFSRFTQLKVRNPLPA